MELKQIALLVQVFLQHVLLHPFLNQLLNHNNPTQLVYILTRNLYLLIFF
nr:MAG TPA: hypothetical protein [Crassvirales sp.]